MLNYYSLTVHKSIKNVIERVWRIVSHEEKKRDRAIKMTNKKFSYVKGINGHYEIALSVTNYSGVDKAFETVVNAGAQAVMWPITEEWGQRTCYIADPEGNLIEIGSFTKG